MSVVVTGSWEEQECLGTTQGQHIIYPVKVIRQLYSLPDHFYLKARNQMKRKKKHAHSYSTTRQDVGQMSEILRWLKKNLIKKIVYSEA